MKKIFFNGTVITLEGEQSKQAVLVERGLIAQVGSNEEILAQKDGAKLLDLEGKTLMPAFIDAHSHLSSCANSFLQVSLTDAESFDDIIKSLKEYSEKNKIKQGQWMIAAGYDHTSLKERKHPTKQLLDQYFPDVCVVLQHKSGHFGVFNSTALAEIGIEDNQGNGYLEESYYVTAIKKVPLANPQQLMKAIKKAQMQYASFGITTVQEGMMVSQMLPMYQMFLNNHCFLLDVVGYPQLSDADLFYQVFPTDTLNNDLNYKEHFRLGGYKIFLDGSPQGKTAWMKTPYQGTTDCYGTSTMSDKEVTEALIKATVDGKQLLAHCNGDAAAEQYLTCAEALKDKVAFAKTRPVMIHAQLLAPEQLIKVKELGIIPSFFTAHSYYWGDIHIQNFGLARASKISPAKSALNNDILFTFHQDAPVIEANMLETIWCAVNRRTKSGVLLGEEECISVLDAWKAVTINTAYQYGEEKQKGSIAPGKVADFVLLDQNPLQIAKEEINTISVLKTFKSSECVYEKVT